MKTLIAVIATAIVVAAVTYVSSLSAQSPYNSRRALVSAELLAAAITATGPTGASGASGILLNTLAQDCTAVSFENTTGVEIDALITAPGASTSTKKRIPAGQFRQYGLGGSRWATNTVIRVFGNAVAPTGGAFEFACQPY